MPNTPSNTPSTRPAEVELPASAGVLIGDLRNRLLAIGAAADIAADGSGGEAVARSVLRFLRSRLDELAPEVVTMRDSLREANRERDEAVREATILRDARDALADDFVSERRFFGATRTAMRLADARRRTVAGFLRRDADAACTPGSPIAKDPAAYMRWAADMLDAGGDEGVAL